MNVKDRMPKINELLHRIDNLRNETVDLTTRLLRIKAVNPDGGGEGEFERAEFLQQWLEGMGMKVNRFEVPDERVPQGTRVSLTTTLDGTYRSRTMWLISHLDTVPAGKLQDWKSDPFVPVVKDGKIFARGAEDDGQAIASSLLALKAIKEMGAELPQNLSIALLSDGDGYYLGRQSARFGAIPLLGRKIFGRQDMCLVPDAGEPSGDVIEVGEKSLLWVKLTVRGHRSHATTPGRGPNAHRVAAQLSLALDDLLHSKYTDSNPLFDPSRSTFEPTRHFSEADSPNIVDNVNMISSYDVQYFDCRVLPSYSLNDVMADIRATCEKLGKETGATIDVERVQYEEHKEITPADSEIVRRLSDALKVTRGVHAKVVGIGGGTLGAYFREAGIQTAVWATMGYQHSRLEPNEYCVIDNIVNDAKTFALAATQA